jgi:hypothetical protein
VADTQRLREDPLNCCHLLKLIIFIGRNGAHPLMPYGRCNHIVMPVANRVIVFGGNNDSVHPYDQIDSFDPTTQRWTSALLCPRPLVRCHAVRIQHDIIFVVGSTNQHQSLSMYWFIPFAATQTLQSINLPADLALPTYVDGLSAIGNCVYILGCGKIDRYGVVYDASHRVTITDCVTLTAMSAAPRILFCTLTVAT